MAFLYYTCRASFAASAETICPICPLVHSSFQSVLQWNSFTPLKYIVYKCYYCFSQMMDHFFQTFADMDIKISYITSCAQKCKSWRRYLLTVVTSLRRNKNAAFWKSVLFLCSIILLCCLPRPISPKIFESYYRSQKNVVSLSWIKMWIEYLLQGTDI